MKLELLKEYVEFAQWSSISKAAEVLHITQSCLSKHIAELERETGLRLVNRQGNKVSLTPVGNAFLENVSYVLSVYESGLEQCKELQKIQPRTLKMQEFLMNKATTALFGHVAAYRKDNPDTDVTFRHLIYETPYEVVLDGTLDVALEIRYGNIDGYKENLKEQGIIAHELTSESLVIWHEKKNEKMASADEITFDLIKNMPIITSSGEIYDYMREATRSFYASHGAYPRFKATFMTISPSAFFMADFKDAIFLTTEYMLQDPRMSMRDDIVGRIVDDPEFRLTTYVLVNETNEDAMDFLDFVRGRSAH